MNYLISALLRLFVTAIGIAACVRSPSQPATVAPERSATAISPTADPRHDEIVLTYSRSGGIAGITEAWTIHSNGRINAPDNRTLTISRSELDQAVAAIDDLGFFELEQPTRTLDRCADCFAYSISVRAGDRLANVSFSDAQLEPSVLWDALRIVQDLLASAEPQA